jgi:hypothetical protein
VQNATSTESSAFCQEFSNFSVGDWDSEHTQSFRIDMSQDCAPPKIHPKSIKIYDMFMIYDRLIHQNVHGL